MVTYIMLLSLRRIIFITFNQKSLLDVCGSLKDFLLHLPFTRLVTFRQSKNLSIILTNFTVSLTSSPPVSSKAFATDLKCKHTVYVAVFSHFIILYLPETQDQLIAHVHTSA